MNHPYSPDAVIEHDPGYTSATFQACPVVLAHPGNDLSTLSR
jgi:hypothetical protein